MVVACYENVAVNRKASIFVSYVVEEFRHAFSCAYIELWMHLEVWRALKKLELYVDIASCNSYASFVLSKLPACMHNLIYAH